MHGRLLLLLPAMAIQLVASKASPPRAKAVESRTSYGEIGALHDWADRLGIERAVRIGHSRFGGRGLFVHHCAGTQRRTRRTARLRSLRQSSKVCNESVRN